MSISARKAKGTRIRDSRGDRVFTVVNYIILTLFGLAALYPLIYVLSASEPGYAALLERLKAAAGTKPDDAGRKAN